MAARLVNVDRETAMLLPPDLRDWVAKDDLVNFLIDAVESCDLRLARVNERGTGSEQYPPGMMLALLIYCYAHRLFSSREIERATYSHVSVRYLCANLHPDHDTVAKFRRENGALLEQCFVSVLQLAREMKAFGQLGTVSVDGTKLQARASRNANRTGAELEEEIARLQGQIQELLAAAEQADVADAGQAQSLAPELQNKQARQAALRAARERLEERQTAHRQNRRRRDAGGTDPEEPSPPSCPPRGGAGRMEAPLGTLKAESQPMNLADPESRLMRDAHGRYLQAYNAQFTVEAGGSQLILGVRLTQEGNDRRALAANLQSVPAEWRSEIRHVLADTGYDNADLIAQVEKEHGLCVLCPPQSAGTPKLGKSYRCTRVRERRQALAEQMRQRLEEPAQQARYRRRSATVEPVIGVLKNVLGFQRFRLFGLARSQIELTLVSIAYNLRRLAQHFAPNPA
jgi:transposase